MVDSACLPALWAHWTGLWVQWALISAINCFFFRWFVHLFVHSHVLSISICTIVHGACLWLAGMLFQLYGSDTMCISGFCQLSETSWTQTQSRMMYICANVRPEKQIIIKEVKKKREIDRNNQIERPIDSTLQLMLHPTHTGRFYSLY